MSSVLKGDKLEEAFHQYLLDQKRDGQLLFGVYPPENCKIFKKKSYYCRDREADVEFDVVIELYAQGRVTPHLHIIFECKNHRGNVSETHVTDFSDKIGRIFPNAVKGILVVTSRLQSGAEKLARNRKMGIVKYDENGLEIVADRLGGLSLETGFVESQIFQSDYSRKSLKFSAYSDGRYFGDVDQLIRSLDPEQGAEINKSNAYLAIQYKSAEAIKVLVKEILKEIDYKGGPVDLERVCLALSICLIHSEQDVRDIDGVPILGSANFTRKLITINAHGNKNRERFTLGHEIGHFQLKHESYLTSETIIERDLLIKETSQSLSYERLEYQANTFSSNLILPDDFFRMKVAHFRYLLQFRDIGHGYIFVDDQPHNRIIYDELLTSLSNYFEVSKQAIQIKLKSLNMLTDQRESKQGSALTNALQTLPFLQRKRQF